jgi:hypothetical protein
MQRVQLAGRVLLDLGMRLVYEIDERTAFVGHDLHQLQRTEEAGRLQNARGGTR